MKRLIYLLLIFSIGNASAQNGFFVQPQAGLGFARLHGNDIIIGSSPTNNATSYITRISGGYEFHRWEAMIGLAWWQTRFSRTDSSTDNFSRTYINQNTLRFSHLLLPVSLAKKIDVGTHLYLSPSAGVEYCHDYPPYIYGTVQYGNNSSKFRESISDRTFDRFYKRQIFCLTTAINCQYAMNQKISIIIGAEMHYMLQPVTNSLPIHLEEERQYAYILTGGVRWSFIKTPHRTSNKPSQAK